MSAYSNLNHFQSLSINLIHNYQIELAMNLKFYNDLFCFVSKQLEVPIFQTKIPNL